MAAAELNAGAPPRRASRALSVLLSYGGLWALTLAFALLTGIAAAGSARAALGLTLSGRRAPRPELAHVLALSAHNLPIAAWPLLLGLWRARERASTRLAADVLVAACAVANTLPVGAAIGGYGPALFPFVPQLPLEWGALAVGYGSWLTARRRALTGLQMLGLLALILALVLLAASVETMAVPHR